jgi:small-conductance mechanosensitive channel
MKLNLDTESLRLLIATASFVVLLVIIFFIYKILLSFFTKKASRRPVKLDHFILGLFKVPVLWIVDWILFMIFTRMYLSNLPFIPYLLHINKLLLVFSITWIVIQFIKLGTRYLENKLDIAIANNLDVSKKLTQINVFKGIAESIVVIIAIAAGLLTFDEAKTIGLSLLTSAGIIGVIVGFAAQKSLGMMLAGIQIAITQPIRLDDVVIVEGEWGRIEEIALTYVVVKIWDERRLILPVTWFLEKPFQNWTRTNADITGTVFLYVDYDFPVESIRIALPDMLKDNPNWDGRIVNVQITKATERFKEIRVLLSSSNASQNWDLCTTIREKLIDFINVNYPDAFAKIRIKEG